MYLQCDVVSMGPVQFSIACRTFTIPSGDGKLGMDLGTRLASVFLSTVTISTPLVCTHRYFHVLDYFFNLQHPAVQYASMYIETHEYL